VAHGELVMLGGYVAYWGFAQWLYSPLISASSPWPLQGGGGLYIAVIRRCSLRFKAGRGNSLLVFFGISIIVQKRIARFTANNRAILLDYCDRDRRRAIRGKTACALAVASVACFACAAVLSLCASGMAMRAIIQHREAPAGPA